MTEKWNGILLCNKKEIQMPQIDPQITHPICKIAEQKKVIGAKRDIASMIHSKVGEQKVFLKKALILSALNVKKYERVI